MFKSERPSRNLPCYLTPCFYRDRCADADPWAQEHMQTMFPKGRRLLHWSVSPANGTRRRKLLEGGDCSVHLRVSSDLHDAWTVVGA